MECLRYNRCAIIQGYSISHPQEAQQIMDEWLRGAWPVLSPGFGSFAATA